MPVIFGNSRLFAIIIFVTFFFLLPDSFTSVDAKGKGVKGLISETLNKQRAAWNAGDLDSFMASYLNAPDISYTSGGKTVWGFETLKDRYKKKYGIDKSTMGHLAFSDLKVKELGSKNALCVGQWNLSRGENEKLQGVFSLVLTKTKDGWKIIHDHTSVLSSDS